MSFLEKARERRARDEMKAEDQEQLDRDDGGMPELLFACEDEILAVVCESEAILPILEDALDGKSALRERLDALDKKADEVG